MAYGQKPKKEIEIDGIGIYTDSKGRKVYWDSFRKAAFILSKADGKIYYAYQFRWVVALFVGILPTYYNVLPWYVSLIIAVLVVIGGEIYFRVFFLPKHSINERFIKPISENVLTKNARDVKTPRMIINIILGLALAIVSYLNVKENNFTGLTLYANYLMLGVAGGIGIFFIVALIVKKINKY